MEHSLPAVHALHLAEVVDRWGIGREELFAGLPLRESDLVDPEARMSIATVQALVARARTLTKEPAIGFHLGLQMRISAHGYLGFAAMTAANVREALELATRFAPTRTTALALRLHRGEEVASLVIEERADFGAARDVVLLAIVVGIWQIGNALTGRLLDGVAVLAFPEPEYATRFSAHSPRARYGQPANHLVFPAGVLDLPLTNADPAALRLARDACERALDALGDRAGFLGRVRELLPRPGGGFRTLEETADVLALSPRTLKRRLAAAGVPYSQLVEDQQRERALLLLRSPDRTIDAIAEELGYSDVANFGRAFRRWTGTTPAAYRKRV